MQQPETKIQTAIQKWVRQHGGLCWKVQGTSTQGAGQPDLDGALYWKGMQVHFKWEVKTLEGEPTRLQLAILRKWHRFGYLTAVITGTDTLPNILNGYVDYHERMLIYGYPRTFRLCMKDEGIEDIYNIWGEE